MAHSNFIISSIRERLALQQFMSENDFSITQMSSPTSYAKWDAVIISADTEMLLEVKVRDWNSMDFPDWILEENKYLALKSIQAKKNRPMVPYYVNVFRDGICLFNLDNLQLDFVDRDSKQSVMTQDGKRKNKSIAMLPLSAGTFYEFPYNFDWLNNKAEDNFKAMFPGVKFKKMFRNGR
jgi:hypothetical protein